MSFQRSRDGRTVLHDAALAGVLFVGSVLPLTVVGDLRFTGVAALWSLVMCASVVFRRIAPLLALAIATIAGAGMVLSLNSPIPAILAVPIVAYSVGRHQRMSSVAFVIAFALIGGIAGPISWTTELPGTYRVIGTTILVLLCFAIVGISFVLGRLLRERALNERLDEEIATERFLASRLQSAQESELAAGRARIEVARELHDVLAHSLSIIVVQAEGARALTTKRPEAAVEALDVIAETGRKSIGEVRRIVSVMRGESEAPTFGPAPSLAQIPELIARSGDRITLETHGQVPLVPESLGLTVFRVVQEAITNFLKHAGPTARAQVVVSYEPADIVVSVRDDGIGILSKADGSGSGVPGMKERVSAMGGEFSAGPNPGGGYVVKARLPMPRQLGKSWLRGS